MNRLYDAFNTDVMIGDHVAFVHGLNTLQRGLVTGCETIRGVMLVQLVVKNLDGTTTTLRVHPAQCVKLG